MILLIKNFFNFIKKIIYHLFKIFLFNFFYNIKVFGNIEIENSVGCILCCNHTHFLDACLLYILFDKKLPNLKILAKKELFDNFILKHFLYSFNAIPINRQELNIEKMRFCIKCLNSGDNIIIFPEGTRVKKTDNIISVKSGVGFLAYKTNAQIIPIYISPITNKFKSDINIYIGDIIQTKKLKFIDNIKNKRMIYKLISEYIMKNIYEIKKNNSC